MSLTTIFLQIDVWIKAINTAIITLADEEIAYENWYLIKYVFFLYTVDSEILARILFSRFALKDT